MAKREIVSVATEHSRRRSPIDAPNHVMRDEPKSSEALESDSRRGLRRTEARDISLRDTKGGGVD
jgi:hypothetical protein